MTMNLTCSPTEPQHLHKCTQPVRAVATQQPKGFQPMCRPFVKWVGGKSQLIEQLTELLPKDFSKWEDVTYIEPFVGGGAMLFHMLQTYNGIHRAVISDINPKLITCYRTIKTQPEALIDQLDRLEKEYLGLPDEATRKDMYLLQRAAFNQPQDDVTTSALFIFLNRTCFNGLYRENKRGLFNVPHGRYAHPTICDEAKLWHVHRLLQKVQIYCCDFTETFGHATGKTLFYFDPPYKPLSPTSSFNDYTKQEFDDEEQVRLKLFCDKVDRAGFQFMLSNSDCPAQGNEPPFFDHLYAGYPLQRVWAKRCVNAKADRRGAISEIVVRNF